jgi:hypothetical protein
MEKVTISKGQIWTKKSPTGKRKDRNYEVRDVFPDGEIDTLVVLRDHDTQNPEAKDAHAMLNDPSWIYRPNATIVEEIKVERTIDFGDDDYTSTKPKKKKKKKKNKSVPQSEVKKVFIPFPVKEKATATGVDIKREAQRQCAETQNKGKKPTDIAKALANAKVKPTEKSVVPILPNDQKEGRDWNAFNHYRYNSFDIFANILKHTETVSLYTIRAGFKNGFFRNLHSQAIDMWRDNELSLNQIRLKQPTEHKDKYTGEKQWYPSKMHNFVIRMIKAIYHFGTAEEKKALFEEFN